MLCLGLGGPKYEKEIELDILPPIGTLILLRDFYKPKTIIEAYKNWGAQIEEKEYDILLSYASIISSYHLSKDNKGLYITMFTDFSDNRGKIIKDYIKSYERFFKK